MRRQIVASLACALVLSATPTLAQEAPLEVSGRADGELESGETITLHLDLTHQGGAREVDEIEVALRANDRDIEAIVLEPEIFAVKIPGSGSVSFLETKALEGAFFSVVGERVRLDFRGKRLRVTLPVKLLSDPPDGARLAVSARAGVARVGPVPITEPAERGGAISWAGILLAAGVALFVGAAAGATVSARRRPTPSLYDGLRRKLEEPTPDDPSPPAGGKTPARKAPAKKAPARKAPAKRAPSKRVPAKKAPVKRAASGRRPSSGGRGGRPA